MISISENISNMLGLPARQISARVELYNCSTLQNEEYNRELLEVFPADGALKEFKVERVANDGKFFGFGVSQKLTTQLRDKDRAIDIQKGQVLEISFGVEGDYTYPCPLFRVEEVTRDENNNDLTITSHDFLYKAGEHRVEELELPEAYTIREFVLICAHVLNLPVKFDLEDDSVFDLHYPQGANLDGSETLREALNAVADATQTIFFVDWDWRLTFRRLDKDAEPALTIDKSKYFELKTKGARTLTTVCHATELGDNIETTTGEPGVTQYVRNNPFWDLREDIVDLLEGALARAAGITIDQIDCSWRGNFALEIGDRINVITKDNTIVSSYVLNDTLTYTGGLSEQTFWNYTEHSGETAANPITLGEAIKQTYAQVDKVNRTITLLASETDARLEEVRNDGQEYADQVNQETLKVIEEKSAEIQLTTDAITSRVENTETRLNANDENIVEINSNISSLRQSANEIFAQVANTETLVVTNTEELRTAIDGLDEEFAAALEGVEADMLSIQSSLDMKMTAEDLSIEINKVLEAGTTKVETTTGFRFDEEGLNVSKSGSDMTTTITEDGMTVYRNGSSVLVADNEGVLAEDLKATTYLIVGVNSRFEDYGSSRTGCFYIGG